MNPFARKFFLTFTAFGAVSAMAHAQLLTPTVVTKQTLLKSKTGLASIRKQISAEKQKEKLDEMKELKVLKRIRRVNQTLHRLHRAQIHNRVDLKQSKIKTVRLREEVDEKQEELQESRQMLAQRLRELYRASFHHPFWEGLLDADNFTDLSRQLKFGIMLARSNEELLERTLQDEKRLQKDSNLWTVEADQKEKVIKTLDRKEVKYDREQKNHAVYLDDLRRQKLQREQIIQELMKSAQNLQNKVSQMLAQEVQVKKRRLAVLRSHPVGKGADAVPIPIQEGKGLRVVRGRIPWPVSGKIISYFGIQRDRQFNLTVDNVGIQIQAPYGTPIHAVGAGVVKFADWFKGYGKLVILDHGKGYYSLYAQASNLDVSQGQWVAAGQILGTVGDTDSLMGNSLYFEIRKNGVPQNPLHWLKYRD